MVFFLDWTSLGSPNGQLDITDAGETVTVDVASDPSVFFTGFSTDGLAVSGISEPQSSLLDFSRPVTDISFEIFDVDADTDETAFDDSVTIVALDANGNQVPVVFSNLSVNHVVIGNTVDAEGNASVAVEGPGAEDTITVSINQPIVSLEVIFAPGDSGTNTGAMILADITFDILCFTSGALIETSEGPRPVETLEPGDLVLTRDHGFQTLRWSGSRTVPAEGRFAPIRLEKGQLGLQRDLIVSPQHRMLISGHNASLLFDSPEVLIAAKHLVNGTTIRSMPGGNVEYIHLLFDRHEIIFVEGAATESLHPNDRSIGLMPEDARNEICALFPELMHTPPTLCRAARPILKAYEARALRASSEDAFVG